MLSALFVGIGAGLVVAAQVGPIWLLCARTALRGGTLAAAAIGLGAAVIDLLYAALGVAGAAPLLQIDPLRVVLGVVGAAVLVALGVRTLASAHRIRLGAEIPSEVDSPARALRTGLVATASNPMTIASWAAVFGAASTAEIATGVGTTGALLLGVGAGSMTWFLLLSGGMSVLGRRVGDRGLVAVDALAGAGLIGFGGLLGWRAATDPG
jgi:putative LysE/RhtB family amino acid efflux pump